MSLNFDSASLRNHFITAEHEEWRAHVRHFFDTEIMPFVAE